MEQDQRIPQLQHTTMFCSLSYRRFDCSGLGREEGKALGFPPSIPTPEITILQIWCNYLLISMTFRDSFSLLKDLMSSVPLNQKLILHVTVQ